ncbi:hypothetical protein N7470_000409 [Penicillium chermesinum]|nr:hypothetical protein N7470_000409 [Penicillium chermesinum]
METDGIIRTLFRNMRTGARNMVVDDFLGQAALPRGDRYQSVVHNATKRSSTFTFTGGLQQLSDALAENLTTSPKRGDKVNTSQISSKNSSKKETFDRVIASIPAPALADILDKKKSPPGQKPAPVDTVNLLKMNNYATTVMVVNLYYSDPDLLRQEGFGYLIPRSIPFEENPDCALGVIFASASSKGTRPDLVTEATQDTAPGTKLTIMFGGHYWDGWSRRDYPDHDSAVRMARRTLQRHLGIMQAPKLARSRLQVDAIPQYTVGHLKNTFALSARVMRDFNRKLTLAGNWYNGVGVNDCVRQGLVAATFCVGNQGPGFQDKTPSVGWNPDVEFPVAEWNVPPEGGVAIAPSRYVTVTPRKGFPALGKSPTDSTKTTRN